MELIITNNANKPIYEQIGEQIKSKIISGELQAGEPIPSMRGLAKSLRISVITVQKAYENLQREGFIETTVGRGSFVAEPNKELILEEKQREIESYLEKAVDVARGNGIEKEKLIELIELFYLEEA